MDKIDRAALRQKIQQLEGLTDDERAALLERAAEESREKNDNKNMLN